MKYAQKNRANIFTLNIYIKNRKHDTKNNIYSVKHQETNTNPNLNNSKPVLRGGGKECSSFHLQIKAPPPDVVTTPPPDVLQLHPPDVVTAPTPPDVFTALPPRYLHRFQH